MSALNILLFRLGLIFTLWTILTKKNTNIEKHLNNIINKYYKYIVIILFILIIFTSTYKLGKIPYGLHVDEAGMAYDALALSNLGTDRYLNKFPVYLINYGGGQSAMYAYLTAILIKLFGYSTIIIRLPSVILRFLLSISIFLIIKDEKNKLKNILLLLLLAICPYLIMQSRWGLDCNLLISFLTISTCLFYKAIKKNSNLLLFLSSISFGLTLYTYALSYLIISLFLSTTIIYLLIIKKINIKKLLIFSIPLALLATPLILMILVNNNIIPQIKSFITIPKLPNYRGSEISLKNIPNNLYIIKSILSHDNNSQLIYNATPEFGTIYYFTIPFILLGFYTSIKNTIKSIKNKKINSYLLFTNIFLSVLIVQLLILEPNINKANAIFISIIFFATQGIYEIINKKTYTIIPIIIILLANFTIFTDYYFNHYNEDTKIQPFFATYYLDALDYSRNLKKDTIYVDVSITTQPHIYILLNNFTPPENYSMEKITTTFEGKEITYIMQIPPAATFPSKIDLNENNVYIVRNNNPYVQLILENNNFKSVPFERITVYHK